jgi:hypothetical protein
VSKARAVVAITLAGMLIAACGSSVNHAAPKGTEGGALDSGGASGNPDSGTKGDATTDSGLPDVTAADSGGSSDAMPTADAPVAPDSSPGADAAIPGYPAVHATPPEVLTYGGPVMMAPNVVPIFFANDPFQAQIEQFLTELKASSYWPAATAEYGVGPLTISPSIVVTDLVPTTVTDAAIQTWLAAYLANTQAGWPAITFNNIYVVFYQAATTVTATFGGTTVETGCQYFGGYHEEGAEGNLDAGGVPFVYAVIPRCAMFAGLSGIDATTGTLSHELVEATTDPLVNTSPAYDALDPEHVVWDFAPLPELGDMCAYEPQSFQKLVGSFVVQRIWSNNAAAAGGDPCVPALTTPYYNASPLLTDMVMVTSQGQAYPTTGLSIPVGQTKMMSIQFFSSAPAPAWTVFPEDTSYAFNGPQLLSFNPAQVTGKNGDVVQVAVTAVAAGPLGGTEFLLQSYQPTDTSYINYWFGFVQN